MSLEHTSRYPAILLPFAVILMPTPSTRTSASTRGNRVRSLTSSPPIFPLSSPSVAPQDAVLSTTVPRSRRACHGASSPDCRDGCIRQAGSYFSLEVIGPTLLITSMFTQLEYDNIEGMILLSELSRRRIRSIQKLIRVGRNEVVVVLRVDKEKGEQTSY